MEADSGNYTTCVKDNVTDGRVGGVVSLTIAASLLSVVGSSMTIFTFLAISELRRSTVRQIITFLAVADWFTSATYLMAALAHFYFFEHNSIRKDRESQFHIFCKAQAFLTSYFSVASFFWTAFLPMYFVLPLAFGIYRWKKRIILTFSLAGWLVPLLPCIPAISLGYLGPSHEYSNIGLNWCFISDNGLTRANSKEEFHRSLSVFFLMQAVCLRIWEFLVYLVTFTCYMMIVVKKCQYRKQYQRMLESSSSASPINPMDSRYSSPALLPNPTPKESVLPDLKLLSVPFAFLLLRCWGTVRYFISMRRDCFVFVGEEIHSHYCLSLACFNILYDPVLLVLQGFCDPLQGFVNAILFVLLSRRVRRDVYRMMSCRRGSTGEEACQDICSKVTFSRGGSDADSASKYGSVTYIQ